MEMSDQNRGTAFRICVLIPARNEALVIGRTLESIIASVPAHDVYVVDDGSSDHTGEIAASFGVHVLRNPVNSGKASSVRKASTHFQLTTRYNIISMMDADTLTSPNYFDNVRKAFQRNPTAAAVCGQVKGRKHNWITAYRTLQYFLSDVVFKSGQSSLGVITVAAGCSTSYRADVFAQLEWVKDTVTEDMDVTIQIYRRGLGPILYASSAQVTTQDPLTLRDYGKQIRRWNTGAWQIGRKFRMWGGSEKIDLEFQFLMGEGLLCAILLFVSAISALTHPMMRYPLLSDMLVCFAMSLVCAIRERRLDVLVYSPLYVVLRFFDCLVFISCFVAAVVLNKPNREWGNLQRYPVLETGKRS